MIPGIQEATLVENTLYRLGIRDVKLLFDGQLKMWAVCQVRKRPVVILTMDQKEDLESSLMWWVKDASGKYRNPSEKDVSDVIATVHRAEVSFQKGGDWLADQLDAADAAKTTQQHDKMIETLHEVAKPLKKAIKKEIG